MIYIKSLVAGITAVVIATLLSPFIMGLYVYIISKPKENEAIGWDPISFAHRPSAWLIIAVAVIFMAGFVWEFRRAGK